jgi:PAS domain S-box-containing protein
MTERKKPHLSADGPHGAEESILELIGDGVVRVDARRRIVYLNAAAERMTGVAAEEALGRTCCEALGESICADECPLARALRTGRRLAELRLCLRDAAGREVAASAWAAPLADARGGGAALVLRDLSTVEALRRELSGVRQLGDIVARSARMREVVAVLPRIAESDATVLLSGESGTGKELVARAIHLSSGRAEAPFAAVSCTALPDVLLEDEIFGREGGSPGEAGSRRRGLFETARGGTVFLDEVADVSPALQVRLLRVLQENRYQPQGSTRSVEADVRLMAATRRNLAELVTAGRFRQDFFYRIGVVRVELPPLRERLDDIPALVEKTLDRLNLRTGRDIPGLDGAAIAAFMRHDWPGNVRELENALEHAFVLCPGGRIRLEHLPADFRPEGGLPQSPSGATLAELEAWAVRQALISNGGRKGDAARELGINPSTLWRKMRKMGLK